MKKINLIIAMVALLLLLCSCAASNVSNSSEPATSTKVAEATSSTNQSAAAASNQNISSTTAQWPDEFKDKLPTPVCKITDVTRYDEKSMSGKVTIVNFTDMSKEDAEKYVQALKGLGFKDGVDVNNNEKMIFSGVNQDQTAKNGVNFTYSVADKSGMISY